MEMAKISSIFKKAFKKKKKCGKVLSFRVDRAMLKKILEKCRGNRSATIRKLVKAGLKAQKKKEIGIKILKWGLNECVCLCIPALGSCFWAKVKKKA
jgi:hypothetical protein